MQTKELIALWIDIFNARRAEKVQPHARHGLQNKGSCVIVKSPEAVLYVCGAIISPFAFNLHAYKSNFLPLLDLGRDHGEWRKCTQGRTSCTAVCASAQSCCTLSFFILFFCVLLISPAGQRRRRGWIKYERLAGCALCRLGEPVFVLNSQFSMRQFGLKSCVISLQSTLFRKLYDFHRHCYFMDFSVIYRSK
jgi:hypothetical protein